MGTEEEKEPTDAQTETEAGNEPATDDAVKTSTKAVEAGLASSSSTAKRYLARIRKEHPERF